MSYSFPAPKVREQLSTGKTGYTVEQILDEDRGD